MSPRRLGVGARSAVARRLARALRRARGLRGASKSASSSVGALVVSPLAPKDGFPSLPPVAGVTLASVAAGVRYAERSDVMLAHLAPGTTIAGITTRSATRAAPVLDCEAKLAAPSAPDTPAAILVNAGNANAFTGAAGMASVTALCQGVAEVLDVPDARVFTASTGVIGEPLPHDRILAKLVSARAALAPGGWEAAARAISTTDTFPKGAGTTVALSGGTVTIVGIAKGSGMIAPDMGTMLVYIFTDAVMPKPTLQGLVARAGDETLNCITVDGDTSTSDTLLVAATGASGIAPEGEDLARFDAALTGVMGDLAQLVVRDGEGATKLVEIRVTGAHDPGDARKAARAVANSPLVKTAIAGEDPNWGRIVMAVGKSGAEADRDSLSIRFGDILVAEHGWVAASYREEDGAAHMRGEQITLKIDLGVGEASATVWTCDLTHGYIAINADYRS